MKKVILSLAGVLCCAALFTSCQKGSDSDSGSGDSSAAAPVYVELNVTIPATEKMVEYFDMSISYEAGNEKNTVATTEASWTKTFKVKLPCTIDVKRTVTLKAGQTIPAEEKISYVKGYTSSWKFLDANSKELRGGGFDENTNKGTNIGTKIQEMLGKSVFNVSAEFSFDKDGKRL